VNGISCDIGIVLGWVLRAFWLCMLVYALISWVPSLQGRWSSFLAQIVEPVLAPVRRIIPPAGGLDLSFLVVIILVGWLMTAVPRAACPIYY
jgi:YggT family protein